MIEVSNVPVSLDAALPEHGDMLRREVARALGVKLRAVGSVVALKRSVDARKKSNVHFVMTCAVELSDGCEPRPVRGVSVKDHAPRASLAVPDASAVFAASGEPRPVVVGAGPAGLFAALYLARAGMRPIVVERGAAVDERVAAVAAFDAGGPLDVRTNIQFGEGGAGTFSDGKLNTGTKSPHIRHVLETFVEAGAPVDILVDAKPHIGTDELVGVVRNLRRMIIDAGGEVRFLTQLADVELAGCEGGGDAAMLRAGGSEGERPRFRVKAVVLRDERSGVEERIPATRVVLACGHSARDTFEMVRDAGLLMERKPFAVGVRIEHPQKMIDRAQYGAAAGHPALGAADYKLAVHTRSGRGVYTFCMCPGGEVVAAASEEGGVCVNGMSRHARAGSNANSALLVGVDPADLPGDDVLAGVALQRQIEHAAFAAGRACGAADYTAPAQTVGDFLSGRSGGASTLVTPTYPRGVAWTDLHECLPAFVTGAMEEGLPLLDRKLRGFAHPGAVLTGVEARSSSPVRIVRDEAFQACMATADEAVLDAAAKKEAPRVEGLYPCGEGAGYAGGITSAAVDGLRVAESIAADFLASQAACGEGDR